MTAFYGDVCLPKYYSGAMAKASLRSALDTLAASFADAVLDAIRGASLEELLADPGSAPRRGPGRPPSRSTPKSARVRKPGRLPRRSAADIAKALDQVIALVKTKKTGLRAEQIRTALKMQSKEMPRVLKEGLAMKKLKAKGQKRATTYSAG